MQNEITQKDNERVVTSLPLDNMPCIVPNMNLLRAAIPIAERIVNAGSPQLLAKLTDWIYLKSRTAIR